jgi:hypothetical protein
MDMNEQLLIYTLSHQRRVQAQFRKQTSLNRVDLEFVAFASQIPMFTANKSYKHFASMNIQQARTLKKLVELNVLEVLRQGSQGRPAIYCLSHIGKNLLSSYLDLWRR